MTWTLNNQPIYPGQSFEIDGIQYPANVLDLWPRADLEALGLIWVEPEPTPPPRPRVTKARFGDLFTDAEHAAMNLIRWQCAQMDAVERGIEGNPLVLVETVFRKFDLPAEFIEMDNPMVADGLSLLAMLGVFGDGAPQRIASILANDDPT